MEIERQWERDEYNSDREGEIDDGKKLIGKISNNIFSLQTVKFLEFLASRKFRKMPNLSFRPLNFSSIFMRGEWQIFHEAALKTYYNVLFNLRFEELPVTTDPSMTVRSIIRENEPFVIELPGK